MAQVRSVQLPETPIRRTWPYGQKDCTVHFDSAAQVLEFFRLTEDSRHYRRMVQGVQDIFASTILFGKEVQPDGSCLIDRARLHFFDEIHLWFTEDGRSPSLSAEDPSNTITLSEAFYTEIDQHRIPMVREVVIALANSP